MAKSDLQPLEVVLSIDDYGSRARASYLADYLEFRSVLGDRLPMSQFVDMIVQNDWTRRDLSLASTGASYEESFDETIGIDDQDDSIAERIGSVLRQRLTALRERYPFRIEGVGQGAVLIAQEAGENHDPYLHLLALTLAHTNRLKPSGLESGTIEDAFEVLVSIRLQECGVPCVVVPTYGKYEDKIGPAVASIGLSPRVELAAHSKRKKDGGTDIICNPPSSDPRFAPGFLILGQATCGTTDTWPSKAKQPDGPAWRRMLDMDWDPLRFLAVPQHVDQQTWPALSQDSGCVVIDRVRLVAMGVNTTTDCVRIARGVFGANPDDSADRSGPCT